MKQELNDRNENELTGMGLLTIRNEDGHGQCGYDDEGSDGHKPLLRDGLLHMKLM